MMKRKFTALLLGVCITALAAGCGSKTAGTEEADGNADSAQVISTSASIETTTEAQVNGTRETAEKTTEEQIAGTGKNTEEMTEEQAVGTGAETEMAAASQTSAEAETEKTTAAQTDSEAAAVISDTGNASEFGKLADFSAELLDGSSFTQKDVAEKDVTVFNFWSVTCGPCVYEMPELAALSEKLPDNVQIVTVCLDGDYGRETAEKILKNAGYDGKTIISWDGDLSGVIGSIQYTPTTVMAGSDGTLLGDAIIGSPDDLEQTYLEAINYALKVQGKESVSLEE